MPEKLQGHSSPHLSHWHLSFSIQEQNKTLKTLNCEIIYSLPKDVTSSCLILTSTISPISIRKGFENRNDILCFICETENWGSNDCAVEMRESFRVNNLFAEYSFLSSFLNSCEKASSFQLQDRQWCTRAGHSGWAEGHNTPLHWCSLPPCWSHLSTSLYTMTYPLVYGHLYLLICDPSRLTCKESTGGTWGSLLHAPETHRPGSGIHRARINSVRHIHTKRHSSEQKSEISLKIHNIIIAFIYLFVNISQILSANILGNTIVSNLLKEWNKSKD